MDFRNLLGIGGFNPADINLGPDPIRNIIDIDVARGALPGSVRPELGGLSPEQLGQTDRYTWGQIGGLGGFPVAAGYEMLKGIQQSPIGAGLAPAGRAFNSFLPNSARMPESWWVQDETTSPASAKNVGAYLQGALSNWF